MITRSTRLAGPAMIVIAFITIGAGLLWLNWLVVGPLLIVYILLGELATIVPKEAKTNNKAVRQR